VKSFGSNPLVSRPLSSFTITGTITWFTLVVILYNSSWGLPGAGVAPPSGTVLIFSGGLLGGVFSSGAGAGSGLGLASPEAGGVGWAAGGVEGNVCGGRDAEGASGMSCFGCCSGCDWALPRLEARQKTNIASQPAVRRFQVNSRTGYPLRLAAHLFHRMLRSRIWCI
jgi:hypothetical protein